MKSLVVVESPSKVKSIKKYLGKDYDVIASKGHIVDLPKSDIGVDTENGFKPAYIVTKSKALQDLKKAFQGKDTLILAVDPDREGEAIGWHVAQKLGVLSESGKIKKGKFLKRIVFTSITKDAVQEAVNNPREIDMNLVDAQQSRRILDRLVGYKLSPMLWKKIRFGLSAGRVQSVAVRMIVEREEERNLFNPSEYWSIDADLNTKKQNNDVKVVINLKADEVVDAQTEYKGIKFELSKIKGKKAFIGNQKEADVIIEFVKKQEWKVSKIETNKSQRNPKPPFTTSTLQQTAAGALGFSAKRTMSVAQKLYEDGLITYMRTDSTNFSPEAVTKARSLIKSQFGEKFLPEKPNYYKTKAKVAQEAHEAVRPSDFVLTPEKTGLEGDAYKLYKLIWQRALGSQMMPAQVENGRIDVVLGDYIFSTNGQKILFKGYLEVYPEKISENLLPDIKEGQILSLYTIFGLQHFTQPPARYSEASLIKALESHGIGRPSTYVPIISTIQVRQYVTKVGNYFVPSDTGIIVTKLLRDHFTNIVNYEFTAELEDKLDGIANGKVNWVKMMEEFYRPFEKDLVEKDKLIERETYTVLGDAPKEIKCPECKSKMKIKLGKFGRFYSCSKWPECKGLLSEDGKTEEEVGAEANTEAFLSIYKTPPKTDDSRDFLLKKGRFGKFWAHPDYPKVKDARPLEYTEEIESKVYGEKPTAKDGTLMILKKGKFGEYWAHQDYPNTKEVVRINKKEIQMKKEELGII